MSEIISYHAIQASLERCMAAQPPEGIECSLSRDASLLGDIVGEMIWRKLTDIPMNAVTGKHLAALNRWIVVDKQEEENADAA